MSILGIDLGKKKIGVAFADGSLATPLGVFQTTSLSDAVKQIIKSAKEEGVTQVVLGMPQGEMVKIVKDCGAQLQAQGFEVFYHDETLTTKEAQRLSIEAGLGQKKRREMEDAYAATLILQSYIDEAKK